MSLLLNRAIMLFSLILLFGNLVASQLVHTVQVGADGSFYNPPTISAQLNDTVRFVFVGAAHSVVQGAFTSPCVPLEGGFNSGIAGVGSNLSAPAPTWDLIVSNVSQPIWFFCEATIPSSHCAAGMVGAINPPSIQMYNQYLAAAKVASGTPRPSPSLTLTGVGAFATNSPAPTQAPTTSSSSETVSSTSSLPSATPTSPLTTPTILPTADASTSQSTFEAHKGGIIAGIVVGTIVLLILLMLIYYFLKRQRDKATIKDFFSYTVPPPQNMTSRSGSQLMLSFNNNNRRGGTPPAQPGSGPVAIVPNRRPSNEYDFSSGFGRGHAYANVGLENKDPYATSETSGTDSTVLSSGAATRASTRGRKPSRDRMREQTRHGHRHPQTSSSTTGGGSTDINTLAREVAAVLQQQTSSQPPHADQKLPDGGDSQARDPSPAPPPVYRT